MKQLFLIAGFILTCSTSVHAQHKFDNKPFVEGELLVQLEPNVDLPSVLKRFDPALKLQIVEELSAPMRVWLVKFDPLAATTIEVQQLLSNEEAITIADYNYYVEMRETVPNDTQLSQQWHHVNTGQTSGTVDADIDSDLAWDITTGGTTATNDDIVVCIIESANLDHDDLRDNRWINPFETAGNGVDDDGNGYTDDIMGWNAGGNNATVGYGTNNTSTSHGTNCVGMFAAVGDNNLGVVGANWNLKVMVSTYANTTQASVISAYTYPLIQRQRWNNSNGSEGAFVVATSASWGIDNADPSNYPLWCNFYDTLGHYGIINIGATTNSNLNVDVSGDMPTACSSPYMVGVGRTDHNDNTAGGYGVTTIDLGAPGINVRTTANNNGYTTTTGTSFACPLTAGVVGLAYAIPCEGFMNIVKADPQLGADLVLDALMKGTDSKPQLATKFITGGRLNARNTLDSLMLAACNGSICFSPTGMSVSGITETAATLSWDINPDANGYELYYRAVGEATWNLENTPGTSYSFSNLLPCTNYEYYLTTICGAEASTGTAIFTFTTQGCGACVDLAYCDGTSTDANQILFSVTKPSSIANNFTFQAPTAWGANLQNTYASGELVVVSDGTAGDSLGCNTLVNTAAVNGKIAVVYRGSCEFGAKAFNAQNAGAIGVIVINNVAGTIDMGSGANGGSVNIPVAMISNTDGAILKAQIDAGNTVRGILGTKKDWIQGVTVDAFSHVSGDDQGYGDHFTVGPLPITAGSAHTFTFEPGYQTQPYEVYFRAWLDADQNGVFMTDELIYDQASEGFGSVNSIVAIPAGVLPGGTRMRVIMSYKGPGQNTLPAVCDAFSFGEVEDYCVEVTASSNSVFDLSSGEIKLYPNPANDQFTIENNGLQAVELELYDLAGRILLKMDVAAGKQIVDTKDFLSGTYFFRLLDAEGNRSKSGKLQIIK
ncbi:MAG: PA domain-containing protein [Flavobacteriales bacterium]